jgi:hypothetical protein
MQSGGSPFLRYRSEGRESNTFRFDDDAAVSVSAEVKF